MPAVAPPSRLALVSAALAALACGGGDGGPRSLLLAHVLTPEHAVHRAMLRMADELATRTGDALTLQVRHSGQLGAEQELLEKVRSGHVQLTKVSSSALDTLVPEMGVFALPWLFRDRGHYERAVDGEIGEALLRALEPVGLVGLVYYEAGARSFYARRPLEGLESLRGLRVRVQQSPTMIATIRALGAVPVPIPFGPELTLALKKGERVEAAENNPPSYWTQEHWRSCPYLLLDRHTRAPDVLVMNARAHGSLSPSERGALQAAAHASAAWQRATWIAEEEGLLRRLEDAGVTVTRDVDPAPFAAAASSVYETLPEALRPWSERIRALP